MHRDMISRLEWSNSEGDGFIMYFAQHIFTSIYIAFLVVILLFNYYYYRENIFEYKKNISKISILLLTISIFLAVIVYISAPYYDYVILPYIVSISASVVISLFFKKKNLRNIYYLASICLPYVITAIFLVFLDIFIISKI